MHLRDIRVSARFAKPVPYLPYESGCSLLALSLTLLSLYNIAYLGIDIVQKHHVAGQSVAGHCKSPNSTTYLYTPGLFNFAQERLGGVKSPAKQSYKFRFRNYRIHGLQKLIKRNYSFDISLLRPMALLAIPSPTIKISLRTSIHISLKIFFFFFWNRARLYIITPIPILTRVAVMTVSCFERAMLAVRFVRR
ncbi:hypothetical protein GGR51DRAFT_230892 [Nemania sp. FL0031]|nr:hypothetical protein GGR51DRAFT_230892 [Nemania sp. FL0031]